jgi:hypothetical protein
MKKYLKIIEDISGYEYAEIINGVIYKLSGEIIPIEHIAYQTIKEDGFYRLIESTCDGICEIGKPKEDCINKCYSNAKCAVYFLYKINITKVFLTIDQCIQLMNCTVQ